MTGAMGDGGARTTVAVDRAERPTTVGGRVLWALLAVQVALAAAGIGLWRFGRASPGVPAPIGGPPAIVSPTLEEGAAIARLRADAWRPGAQLLSATMQVDWPWDQTSEAVVAVPATGWLTYVFVAPWDPALGREEAASLTVLIDRLSGDVAAQTSLGWEAAPAVTPSAATPAVTSTAAVLVAEASGGTTFRTACPERRHLTRVSLVEPVGGGGLPAHWLVTYEDTLQPGRHGFRVRVDAATAAVLEVEGKAASCRDGGDA
jgi:hypothetical protein